MKKKIYDNLEIKNKHFKLKSGKHNIFNNLGV